MAGSLTKRMVEQNNYQNPYEFANPITINNKEVTELSWSADDITVDLFMRAGQKATQSANATTIDFMENNINYHFWIGCAMFIAMNSEVDFEDLNQIRGSDLIAVTALGRFFISLSVASIVNNSEEPSETTPTNTQPASQKSDKDPSTNS